MKLGVAGVEAVIAVVKKQGFAHFKKRTYDRLEVKKPKAVSEKALAAARLPNGQPLPETWKAWLRFDGAWLSTLGWFESLEPLVFAPRTMKQFAEDQYGAMWAKFYDVARFEHCFHLAGGSDSRRVLVLTDKPDSEGEHPVFFTDIDDEPGLGAMYPGLDAYLAWAAGLLPEPTKSHATYTDEAKLPAYKTRNAHHVKHLLGGEWDVSFPDRLNGVAAKPESKKKTAKPKKKAASKQR